MPLVNAPAQLWEELKLTKFKNYLSLHDVKDTQGTTGRTESHRNSKWVLQEKWSETEYILKI